MDDAYLYNIREFTHTVWQYMIRGHIQLVKVEVMPDGTTAIDIRPWPEKEEEEK